MKEPELKTKTTETQAAEHNETVPAQQPVATVPARPLPKWAPWAIVGALVLLFVILSYGVGYKVGRQADGARGTGTDFNRQMPSGMSGGNYGQQFNSGAGGGPRSAMSGVSGTVTAITSDSISVSDTNRGGVTTFKITSDTKVTDADGNTKAVSDIKSDATVRVRASSSDTNVAASIQLTNE